MATDPSRARRALTERDRALAAFRKAFGFGSGVAFIPVAEDMIGNAPEHVRIRIERTDHPGIAQLTVARVTHPERTDRGGPKSRPGDVGA